MILYQLKQNELSLHAIFKYNYVPILFLIFVNIWLYSSNQTGFYYLFYFVFFTKK